MESVVEAAVAAAAKSGVTATVVIVGGEKSAAPTTAAPAQASAELEQLRAENASLRSQLQAVPAAADSTDAGAPNARIAELEALLRATEAQLQTTQDLLQTQQSKPTAEPPSGGSDTPVIGSFLDEPIASLGAEKKILKALEKTGCKTIGDARTKYLGEADDLKKTGRLTMNDMMNIGQLLVGKAPSLKNAGLEAAPAEGAPDYTTNGVVDSNLPPGIVDRTWEERVKAAQNKEAAMEAADQALAPLYARVRQEHPDCVQPDSQIDAQKLANKPEAAELNKEIREQERRKGIIRGQVLALLWACNLNPNPQASVTQALQDAGVEPVTA